MNHYELYIECKACREGNHYECSHGKNIQEGIVQIICHCLVCNRHRKAIEDDDADTRNSKNVQALESGLQPLSNTNQSLQSLTTQGALKQRND